MEALRELRKNSTRFFVLFAWAHLPLVGLAYMLTQGDIVTTGGIVGAVAIASTVAWRSNPQALATRFLIAAGTMINVGALVYLFAGHSWQIDKGADVRVPWLLVHGDADTVVLPDDSRQIVERAPSATLVEIPGANHLFSGEHELPMAQHVTRWLLEQTG